MIAVCCLQGTFKHFRGFFKHEFGDRFETLGFMPYKEMSLRLGDDGQNAFESIADQDGLTMLGAT